MAMSDFAMRTLFEMEFLILCDEERHFFYSLFEEESLKETPILRYF